MFKYLVLEAYFLSSSSLLSEALFDYVVSLCGFIEEEFMLLITVFVSKLHMHTLLISIFLIATYLRGTSLSVEPMSYDIQMSLDHIPVWLQ